MSKQLVLTAMQHQTLYWALTAAQENIQDLTGGNSSASSQASEDSSVVLDKLADALTALENAEVRA